MLLRKKPKIVFIGGAKYHVYRVGKISGPVRKGGRILGQFRPNEGKILVLNKLKQQHNITITHELIHAICWELDLHTDEIAVDKISRELVGAMSQLGMLK